MLDTIVVDASAATARVSAGVYPPPLSDPPLVRPRCQVMIVAQGKTPGLRVSLRESPNNGTEEGELR